MPLSGSNIYNLILHLIDVSSLKLKLKFYIPNGNFGKYIRKNWIPY
jgi:hypothetical protein